MTDSVNCRVCGASSASWRAKNGYSIFRCSSCGFAFVYPYLGLEEIRAYYSSSGHKASARVTTEAALAAEREFPNSTVDAARFARRVSALNRTGNASLLDVGSGYGFFSREFAARGFSVDAIELAENERAVSEELAGIKPVNTAFEDFTPAKLYGAVCMSQTLEHASDPGAWIRKANALLENSGILAVAVPNFDSAFRFVLGVNEPYIIPPDHLNYFNIKAMTLLLEANGFKFIESSTVSRVNFRKAASKLRVPAALLTPAGKASLKLLDLAGCGMFINAYARKIKDIKA